jgi:hypothetical protein
MSEKCNPYLLCRGLARNNNIRSVSIQRGGQETGATSDKWNMQMERRETCFRKFE